MMTEDALCCTLLVPNLLYVGSERNAADRELLIERNISAIVNAAAPQTTNHFQQEASCYRYHSIDLLDAAEEDLLQHIEPHNRFLEEAEREGRVVLVHCKSGNSRAAALCIAYLMRRHRWPLAKAFAFVKMQRPATQPNRGFLDQLAIYQERLQEEEEQARGEEEEEEEEEDDDDGEDEEEEEDPMETELARRRAAFMRRYAGGGDATEDDSDEGPGEEYAMDVDEDDAAVALNKGKDDEQMNVQNEQEKRAEEEDEDEDPEEEEEQREASRRAKAKRDWQRWFAKPPALVDLIVRQRKAALARHVSSLFAAGSWQELKRVYAALRDTPECVNVVRAAYFAATKADAIASAAAIVAAQATNGDEAATIEPVMEWRRTQQSRLESIFGTDPAAGFQRAFEQSLPYFLNPLAKTIVAHIDRTLRNANDRSPKDVENDLLPLLESSLPHMSRSAAAFDYHYANALAGRLLSIGSGQNHRFHVERQVAQLVGRFPSFSGFGGLMEAMVSDAQFSFEMEDMQKSAAKEKVRRGEEDAQPMVSVRLLAADLWPRRRIVPASTKQQLTDADMRSWRGVPLASWPRSYVLPSQVQQKWDAFAAAYVAENPQKRLQYVPHMGTAEVQVVLGESRFFFTVTTPMMCVLHRFAFGHEFSLQELQDETGIPDKELKRTLFSLISPLQGSRTGLLLKRPARGKFEPTDVFSVNASFASRLRKIRVSALPYPPPRKQRGQSSSSSASTAGAAVAGGSSV